MAHSARPYVTILTTLALGLSMNTLASAQDLGSSGAAGSAALDLDVIAGYAGFIDEDMIDHLVAGVSVRWLVTPRLGMGVEVLSMRGPGEDRDWSVVPTLVWDLRSHGRVVPYVTGGAGWMLTTLEVGTGLYSFSSWTASGGGGFRIGLSPSTSLSLEARLGNEPATRLTAAVGWRFGDR